MFKPGPNAILIFVYPFKLNISTIYLVWLICPGAEKDILKEIMHLRYMTYIWPLPIVHEPPPRGHDIYNLFIITLYFNAKDNKICKEIHQFYIFSHTNHLPLV